MTAYLCVVKQSTTTKYRVVPAIGKQLRQIWSSQVLTQRRSMLHTNFDIITRTWSLKQKVLKNGKACFST